MNKKVCKILSTIVLLIFAISLVTPMCFAASNTTYNKPMNGINTNYSGTTSALSDKTESIGQQILGVVQVIAGIAAVILLIVLAIKYMTASPDGKAEIKKSMIIYIVGAALLFGSSMILGAVKDWMTA